MTSTTCELEHPILFVFDFENPDVQIPEYDEDQVVSANTAAISIRVVSEVDGPVTIHLERALPDVALRRAKTVFRGLVKIPGGRISVVTSQNEQLLELVVASTIASVLVAVDNELHPSEVWVGAAAASK